MSEHLNSNSETDIESSFGGITDASAKHHFYNDELTTFYRTSFLSIQNIHFCLNFIKFVLGFITKFENLIALMKNNNQMDENPSSLKWYIQTFLPFKTFIL